MSARQQYIATLVVSMVVIATSACSKKPVAAKTAPPPPPAPAPTATLAASPDALQAGQTAMLTWSTQNASSITINGLGKVAAQGSRGVKPTDSTTYVLTATGPGGTKEASARITVSQPPPAASKATLTDEELFSANVKDVFFAYDKASIAQNQETIVAQDAKFLKAHPYMKLLISGHCDERGSEDYNLTLGDGRANGVRTQLEQMGISADRIQTISYGKEKPFCTEETEACWQLNRRAHFALEP